MIHQMKLLFAVFSLISLSNCHIFVTDVGHRKCDESYLKNSRGVVAEKQGYQYYPWHVFEPPQGKVKFFQIREGNVKELCKYYLPQDVQEVIILNTNLEYIEPGYFQSNILEQVFIQGNKLYSIHRGVFNGTTIRSLVLSDNRIRNIYPRAFESMKRLEAISLDYNSIKLFDPTWFEGARVLNDLTITHNFLTEIPEDATRHICQVLETDTLRKYGSINFDNNNILYIHPDAFRNIRTLDTVSLSNNKVLELPEKVFQQFEFLMSLYMNSNEFICFTNDTVRSFMGVRRLFLGENKFNKECMEELKDFFDLKGDKVYF
ncbi:unnamed protein product [Acanthoscelides obtectus]|uniref:Uncharacterized protein n=1 Tax=Acanthoscelides obtectus TaxID=200917 RepID=A0A9P0JR57_ACAOB|nr:unnamed protein product [Acanthoscelides obtectus]CAK1667922.1 Slit homolog 1 protein [Acanthoscelides obtectus]